MKKSIKDTLINQCINILSVENELLKEKIIDPLVLYFKKKLWWFYLIVTILLMLCLISNIIIIYKVSKIENIIYHLKLNITN